MLTARKLLQEKAIAIENDIRGLLRNFGLKVGIVGTIGFDERIRELVDGMPDLGEIMKPLLAARQKMRGLLYRSHHCDQNARQMGPPHSTDPILRGPKSRSRREARACE